MASSTTYHRNNSILPDAEEIIDSILVQESPRLGKPHTFVTDNPDIFKPIRMLADETHCLDMFGLSLYPGTLGEFNALIDNIEQAKSQLIQKLELGEGSDEVKQSVYRSLAAVDKPTEADALFVFGAPSNMRIDLACKLYHEGYTKKIIISGRGPNWKEVIDETEATRMSKRAVELAIPESDIILEHQALSIPDNVKRTMDLFEQMNYRPRRIMIISSYFVMLRSYMDWLRFVDYDVEIIRISPELVDKNLTAELWHTTENGRHSIINEYAKILHETATNSYLRSHQGVTADR